MTEANDATVGAVAAYYGLSSERARAALTVALPLLWPEPKAASVEEVARVAHPELWGAWQDENSQHFSDLAVMRATSLRRASALLARFNITPKETDHE